MGDAPFRALPKAHRGTVASASAVLLALGCGGTEIEVNGRGSDSGSDARLDSTRPIDGAGGDRAADRGEKEAARDGNVDSGKPPQRERPTKVADAVNPQSIALSPTNVYWADGAYLKGKGAVMSIPRAGAGAPAPVPGGSGLTGPLVVKYSPSGDGTFLAWSAFSGACGGGYNGSVTLENASSGAAPTVPGTGLCYPWGVALDTHNVYWAALSADISSTVIIQAAPLGGGSPVLLGTTSSGVLPYGLAVSSTTAYVAVYSDYYAEGASGDLFAIPLGGGTPSVVWCGYPFDVVVDDVNVYWTDEVEGLLLSMPLAGGSVTTMFSGAMAPTYLAVDSKNVYFADRTGNAIYEVPIGGKGKVLVKTNAPYGIAADDLDDYVYFTSPGAILKHPK